MATCEIPISDVNPRCQSNLISSSPEGFVEAIDAQIQAQLGDHYLVHNGAA